MLFTHLFLHLHKRKALLLQKVLVSPLACDSHPTGTGRVCVWGGRVDAERELLNVKLMRRECICWNCLF